MKDSLEISKILEAAGITPTPVRILVYKSLYQSVYPLSLSDIEAALESVDKSTVSRTLNTFRKHHLLHCFNDGSGSVKYEICHANGSHHDDLHVHFHCEKCGETICLNHTPIPDVVLPVGYELRESSYILSGLCPNCSKK